MVGGLAGWFVDSVNVWLAQWLVGWLLFKSQFELKRIDVMY